ncbi:IPT/TIG domain-containing protein [Streptomyces sp. NPDC002588]|uniref:IPT/TIG domain-containing protein n=1 Tax=Streptomyces sp. NPDC002588 TaxID=3154419 RepID=UPI00332CD007
MPTITAVAPSSGPTTGGTKVTVLGSGFGASVSKVLFGGISVPFTVLNGTTLTCTAPPRAAGTVQIGVVSPSGTDIGGHFDYLAPVVPTVTAVQPLSGPIAGGTQLTISGRGFTGATAVTIGNLPATGFSVTADTSILATAPPHAAGAATVRVTTSAGSGTGGSFTYLAPALPAVTGISPSSGSTEGGTLVTITGTGLTGATAVAVAGVPVASFTVLDATAISAVTAPSTPVTGTVTVTTSVGTGSGGTFGYLAPLPVIHANAPTSGPISGGTAVTITGTGFTSTTAVRIAGVPVTDFAVLSDTTLDVITASSPPASGPIAVTARGGTASGGGYTYLAEPPQVTGIIPNSGSTQGGTTVTITGSGFTDVTGVAVAGVPVASFTVLDATAISAVTAASAPVSGPVSVADAGDSGFGSLFTYLAPVLPVVAAVDARTGPAAGGTQVIVTGTGFTGATAVTFGGVPALDFSVPDDTTILATTPPHPAGSVTLDVTTPTGTVSGGSFGYLLPAVPTVGGVAPGTAPTGGGTLVTVTGTGFTGATAVTLAGTPVVSFTVVDDATISAVTAESVPATGPVAVTTPAGTASGGVFSYLAPRPTVIGVEPSSGPTSGGTLLTITGSGFDGATAVVIAGVPAASFTVDDDSTISTITATTAPSPSGRTSGDVEVVTDGGAGFGGSFTYLVPVTPTVGGVTPPSGPTDGGTQVTVTGSGFTGATAVVIAGVPAADFTVDDDTTITATTATAPPDGITGPVAVTTKGGTSVGGGFAYLIPVLPTVGAVEPSSGSTDGGTSVTVTGSGFTGATAVSFGGVPALGFSVLDDTTLLATTPAHPAGSVTVAVTTPEGTRSGGGFSYLVPVTPTVGGIAPPSGPTDGGTQVTVTGSGFTGATAVVIAGVPAADFTVDDDTTITATTNPASPASGPVAVTTSAGTGSGGSFTYAAPVPEVSGIAPAAGSTAGGIPVVVTGSGFTGATAVTVAGVPVTRYVVTSDTVIDAIVAAAPGPVSGPVTVTVNGSTGSGGAFAYLAPALPVVATVDALTGPTGGGTQVIITGSGFTGATAVSFGGASALDFSVPDDTTILATTPPHPAGTVTVGVTTPAGTGSGGSHTYLVPVVPTVTGIAPSSGTADGGTQVTITGTGLTGTTAITVAGTPVAGFAVIDDTTVSAFTTPSDPIAGPVTVTTDGGTASGGVFAYLAPPPVVSGVLPSSGLTHGGLEVTITGSGFTGATEVLIAGVPAESFTVEDDTVITAVTDETPTPASGAVIVTANGGTGAGGFFDYLAVPPVVTGILPSSGLTTGGTVVTIAGVDFTGTTDVTIAGIPVDGFSVDGNTTITAVTAAAPGPVSGPVTVTASGSTGSGGTFAYLAPALPVVAAVDALTGPTGGGTQVIITGSGFTGATAVSFGGTPALGFSVPDDTTILATTPPHPAGTVTVGVTTPAGTGSGGSHTYLVPPPPAVDGIAPAAGSTRGGTLVTLTGTGFTGATAVTVAGVPAADFTVLSDTAISAITAPSAPGAGPAAVTIGPDTASGGSFAYLAPRPVVSEIFPGSGHTTGGTPVTITGTGFTGTSDATIATVPAADFTVLDDTAIRAITADAETPGTGPVTVTADGGVTSGANFAYLNAPPGKVVSIPVGGRPAAVVLASDGSRLYVTDNAADAVTVISPATKAVVATIPVGVGPWGAAIAPDGGRLYVANSGDGSVSVIDTATDSVIATVSGLSDPVGLAVTPDGTRLYAACRGSDTVEVIDTATNQVSAVIPVGQAPEDVTVSPDGTRVYVSEAGTDAISVIDTGTDAVTAHFTGFRRPRAAAVARDGERLYVPDYDGNSVTVVDAATGDVVETVHGFAEPVAVAVTQDGALAYVTSSGDGTVRVISTVTNALVAAYSGLNVPYGLAIDPHDLSVYVADSNNGTVAVLLGLEGLFPDQGPTGGGTPVTVIGTHLGQATGVHFGTRPATGMVVVNDTAVTAMSPAGQGTVGVTVTTPGGTSLPRPFYYVQPPVVTGLAPAAGPASGGIPVTISGRGLTTTTLVTIGGAEVPFTVHSDSRIDVTTQPGASGVLSVVVTTRGGAAVAEYTAVDLPTVTGISPTTGPTAGDTLVIISGTNLSSATSVTFDDTPAHFIAVSDTRLDAVAPGHEAGPVPVVVTNPAGSEEAPTPYTYA